MQDQDDSSDTLSAPRGLLYWLNHAPWVRIPGVGDLDLIAISPITFEEPDIRTVDQRLKDARDANLRSVFG